MLSFAALLAATPLAAVHYQAAIRDPDIWWHMRVGESITRTHAFPHTAVFTRFAGSNGWAAYSWVFEVILSALYRWFALPALPTFLFVFQIAIVALLLGWLISLTRSPGMGWLLASAALAASFHTLSLRPVLFTVLFFIVEMALIFRALRERSMKALYWLPLVFWLWANCHIQFIDGLLVLGLFCGCALVQPWVSAKISDARPELPWTGLAMILGACVAATLVSPYSWHLYEVVWGYASRSAQWDQIMELTAPSFRRPAHYIELLLPGLAALALGIRRTRSLFRLALLAMAALISFHAVRDAWMVSIVSVAILGEAWSQSGHAQPDGSGSLRWMVGASAALALVLCVAAQARVGYSTSALIPVIDQMYPVRAASFVADRRPPGPLFNSVNWGGYLIYNLREYPVAADGRTDAYGGSIGAAMQVVQGVSGWEQDPVFASSNVVLIEHDLPLARLLERDRDFQKLYEDHLAMIFVRVRPR